MIAHLRGKLISKQPNQAIIEAAGIGYEVNIDVPNQYSDLLGTACTYVRARDN